MNDAPAIQHAESTALYLVGLARGGDLAGFDAPGIEPRNPEDTGDPAPRARPHTIRAGAVELDALVVDVPRDLFAGDDAEERLKDVAWLRPRAERHEAIIREARRHAAMMPVGFGGVFTGTAALEAALADHADAIAEFLDETELCDEWSLKVSVSRADAIRAAKAALADEAANHAAGGAAYLRARRLEGEAEARAEDDALALVEQLIEDLGDTIQDAAQRRTTTIDDDPDHWLIAHIALLIHQHTRAAFDARLDQLAPALESRGLRLELTGPWSPYSFCPEMQQPADTTG